MSRTEALRFLNLAHFFDHFFILIFPTAAIAIAPAWGIGYGEALAFGTPIYVMFALGTLPAGWLGDHFDRMLLIALFFFGCGASSLIVAVSSGPLSLMVGLGCIGLFAALYHPIGLAHIPDLAERTGRALAVNGVFGNMGLAGAAIATGLLTDTFGWRSAFVVPGLVSLLVGGTLMVRFSRLGTPTPLTQTAYGGDQRSIGRTTEIRVFIIICVAALFGGLIFNAMTVSLPKFLDERLLFLDGDLSWIGASAGLVFAVAAFAQLPVGEMLDRVGARPILIGLLMIQIGLMLVLANLFGWTVLPLTLLLVTMIFAEIPITSWLLGHFVQSGLRSRAVSIEYVLSLGIGSAVVPIIAAMHQNGLGFDVQFLALAASASVVLAAALFIPGAQTPTITADEIAAK